MTHPMPARCLSTLLAVAGLLSTGMPQPLHAAPAPKGATLTVVVSGARPGDGPIMASVFASPAGFPLGHTATAIALQPASGGASDTIVFRNLPPGRYAVAVHQDQIANRKIDLNIFGAPKEPWGVSKNVRPTFRAPHFDEAAFDLRGDTRIDVRIMR